MKIGLKAVLLLLLMTLLTGIIYPLAVTGIAQVFFIEKANGSFHLRHGKKVGSRFIGQSFSSDKYFWPRPSKINYNPLKMVEQSFGPTSAILAEEVKQRREFLKKSHLLKENAPIPEDMLFDSASGLDPHISLSAAYFQLRRVARARGWDKAKTIRAVHLIDSMVEHSPKIFSGAAGVNVLLLNLALDGLI